MLKAENTENLDKNWKDSSSNGFVFNEGEGATLNSNDTNGYASYSFNGIDQYFEIPYNVSLNPDTFSIFTASHVKSSNKYKTLISSRDEEPINNGSYNTKGFMLYAIPNSNNWEFWNGFLNGAWQKTSGASTHESWALQSLFYQNSPNQKKLYINNNTPTITSHTMAKNTAKPFRVGAGKNESLTPDYYFKGKISEVIMFNTVLNETQRIIINNYLSAKYNTSLSVENYYAHDDGSNSFDHHVAGIGQAEVGTAHLNSRGTGVVTISSSGLDSRINQFLFWGENEKNSDYKFYADHTTHYNDQLSTKWRVSKTANFGTANVSFDVSDGSTRGIDLSGYHDCFPLQLVIGNDADFSSPRITYDLEKIGSTIFAADVEFNDKDFFTIRYKGQIILDNAGFHNGTGTDGAPHETDDSCLKLTIKAGFGGSLPNEAHIREVEVESDATLTVDAHLLKVENNIINNGTIDLKNEAQLIQKHEGETFNTGTGTLKIRQKGSGNAFNHNYWSSPVNREGNWQIGFLEDPEGHPVKFSAAHTGTPGTPPTLSTRWLHKFDGTNHYNNWVRLSTSDLLAPGLGYTMKGSGLGGGNLQEYIFEGTPNDGDYTIPVTAGFNILVGNPYPSALDAYQFITDNIDVIDGTLYFWEHFPDNNSHYLADYKGGYASYNLTMSVPSVISTAAAAVGGNAGSTSTTGTPSKAAPTGNIPVGQGFFITVNSAPVGDIIFKNSQRVFAKVDNGESVFYRTNATKNKQTTNGDSRPKLWFSFTTKDYIKTIGLGYDLNTTYGYDNAYDAESYDYLQDDIYWLLPENSKKLSIQALPSINLEDNLPLEVKATHAGVYKFEISKMENIPADLPIYLKDNTKNSYYNLRAGEANLYLNAGQQQKQFSIVFKEEGVLGTDTFEEKTLFTTYDPKSNILQIHSSSKETTTAIDVLTIYNSIGQEVIYIKSPNPNSVDVSQLSNGVYILKLNSKNVKNPNGIKFVKY